MAKKLPQWLKKPLKLNKSFFETKKILTLSKLNTVCTEAKCPNRIYCFERKRATFLALGTSCTRHCAFCDIDHGTPMALDPLEPKKIAKTAKKLKLKHIIITMVTRDDLQDFGSLHICKIIKECRKENPQSTIEVLTSDFQEDYTCIDRIILERPDIFNHNIETVESLTPKIRNRAEYRKSLRVLSYIKDKAPSISTKSGFMVGLGEKEDEVKKTMIDLKESKIDIITIGQYLKPSNKCIDVVQYVTPQTFMKYEAFAKKLSFNKVHIGPFVRSSFDAS